MAPVLGAGLGVVAGRARGRRRLPDPAPLPAEPLRGPLVHHARASTPPSPGPATSPDARIATTSTRQYPLFGTDLSNRVAFVGSERPHGGFEAPTTCREWRRRAQRGRLRLRRHLPRPHRTRQAPVSQPRPAGRECPQAKIILRKPPTVVFKLCRTPRSRRPVPEVEPRCRRVARGEVPRTNTSPAGASPLTGPAGRAARHTPPSAHGPHPQLLDHRPHRPRQVDPRRPHPRGHRRRRPDENAGADARLDGPRARARDHDQGPGGAGRVQGRRRRRPTTCT